MPYGGFTDPPAAEQPRRPRRRIHHLIARLAGLRARLAKKGTK